MPTVQLLPGRDRRLRHGYPWAYSNELRLDATARGIGPGSLVALADAGGRPIGTASFNLHSLIAARVMAEPGTAVDRDFMLRRLAAALALRERLYAKPFYRLVHAEADRLPGIVVDRHGEVAVVQANTAGAERLLPELLDALQGLLRPRAIVLRNDSPVRALEGLPSEVRLAAGSLEGQLTVEESGVRFLADPLSGQKTGWFYDLAEARRLVATLAQGGSMLDLYCHTGGFAVRAAAAGAREVLAVDRSAPALALAEASAALNGVGPRLTTMQADAFAALERLQEEARRFGAVVADPPSFVKSRKDLGPGLRAYRKLARLAAGRVTAGGSLFIASCSHNVTAEAFAGEVAQGVAAAGRSGRILYQGGAGPDHPVHPLLPESAYLKWQILQID